MGRPRKNKGLPSNLQKKTDPYAARVVLRELYAKGVFIIKGSPFDEESQKSLEVFVDSQTRDKEYEPIFERFHINEEGYTDTLSSNSDRLIAKASGTL
jgi:DNA-binding transcriptional regulator WhiA